MLKLYQKEMEYSVKGIPNLSARLWFALARQQEKKTDALFIIKPEEAQEALNAAESLLSIMPENSQIPELCVWEGDTAQKSAALRKLCRHEKQQLIFHILSKETLCSSFPDKAAYDDLSLCIIRGKNYQRNKITGRLSEIGYERVFFVEERGDYAVRGSVLDVFPLDAEKPLRLFFDDDLLSGIRYFEIDSQHTSDFLDSFEIPPKNFGSARRPFISFLGKEFFAVSCMDIWKEDMPEIPCLYLAEAITPDFDEDFGAAKNLSFALSPEMLASEIRRLRKCGFTVYFFCINKGEAERIGRLLQGKDIGGTLIPKIGYISEGFVHNPGKIAVITASEYLMRRYSFSMDSHKAGKKFFKWSDLKPGDYVVHEDYGIARYRGLKKAYYRTQDGQTAEDSDCLYLEYARGDALFVPLDDFTKVQKFISSEGKQPHLSHMDTKTWKDMKGRVKEEVREMAGNILRLEAERALCHACSFAHGGILETEFEEAFAYEETPDQKKAIKEVLQDMEGEIPMNRLIAGDVGFGKTEVAMRAAMRAVINGAQAALIAPTTILADQHFRSFKARFAGFPVRIKVLSRFVSAKEQKETLRELESGKADIVIGTHRLLQKDIKFSNLGLMIVDEEHRFGVKAKDRIKETAKGVHCLLMSATPIPRTLYQSLSALKSMSVIESPPVGRQAVSTFVRPFSEQDVASAVAYELARGGQVFYVHNRVKTIDSRCAYLKKIMPELRIAVAHGQLSSESVAGTMKAFLNGEYDVLMATTIIESGIDIPNVNTLIVEQAHELGLAQLYQLRGRIGRGKRKAFCYLYYPGWLNSSNGKDILNKKTDLNISLNAEKRKKDDKASSVSEDAARRLSALEEFTALGSGLRLAMRDLEIRGAGDLLGLRQHGFINSVGLEMYIQLLNGEINRLKGKKPEEDLPDPSLDIAVTAYLPEYYIEDEMERLNYYKKILKAPLKQLSAIYDELEDLSGPAPEPVKSLFRIARLKKRLGRIGVRSVRHVKDSLEIFFRHSAPVSMELAKLWTKAFGQRLSFIPSPDGDGLRFLKISRPIDLLDNFLKITEDKMKVSFKEKY